MKSDSTQLSGDPVSALGVAFRAAVVSVLGEDYADADPMVRPSQKESFGDFQVNCAMSLGKKVGMDPGELARRIVDAVSVGHLAETPEIAGPGFINIRLRTGAIADALEALDHADLGVVPDMDPCPVVIDMCSVNVAKQMHVGHLRSTIIGDALGRVFERLGRTVIRENHLGDWGTPIAMVLHRLRDRGVDFSALVLADLDAAYRESQFASAADHRGMAAAERFSAGPHRLAELEEQNDGAGAAQEEARRILVDLQQGDAGLLADWQCMIDCTLGALAEVIEILGVDLGPENNRGESFYNDRLQGVITAFMEAGLACEDDGALVVSFEDRARPLLIRKSDGGFLYATTDLAAMRFRTHELGASRVIYVVDARQRDHFKDLFDAARLIGWDRTPDGSSARLEHVGFGSVLGKDRKPLKTRSGTGMTLRRLLDEAIERGIAEVAERAEDVEAPTHGLPRETLEEIGRDVGIGAIKYADLSNDLVRDYVFDMDRMITFEGNTGPYLQYAHARVCSIFSRAGVEEESCAAAPFEIEEPSERRLALSLLRYGGVVDSVAQTLELHRLAGYLYELAGASSAFYEHCPVLKAGTPSRGASRLRLCALVKRTLADGLAILGIQAPRCM